VGSQLSMWVARRPAMWGLLSGTAMGVIGLVLFGSWVLSLVVAVPFGIINFMLWRQEGPAHRWRSYLLDRFPKNS
jgi:predicted outer membrane lipoprotein